MAQPVPVLHDPEPVSSSTSFNPAVREFDIFLGVRSNICRSLGAGHHHRRSEPKASAPWVLLQPPIIGFSVKVDRFDLAA